MNNFTATRKYMFAIADAVELGGKNDLSWRFEVVFGMLAVLVLSLLLYDLLIIL